MENGTENGENHHVDENDEKVNEIEKVHEIKKVKEIEKVKKRSMLGKPLKFLYADGADEDRKWVIGQDAIKYLESIERPLAIITIAGIYRTGKSFILNQLAGRVDGFDIGPTVEPCTEGIWLWEVDESTIENAHPGWHYVLLDTEGIGSYTNTETYDIQVFSLALLLSSFFIYNSTNSIDETAMDRLSLVVELTKHIRVQSHGTDKDDPNQFRLYFPNFMWLVRDFALELIVGGEKISPKQYLENALNPVKGDPARVGSKNQIRECIKTFFPDRDCFTLIRPVKEESQLQQLAKLAHTDLRPEYRDQLDVLKQYIYRHVTLKKINNQALNGSMLVELTKQYIAAINDGGVPTISTAWENVVQQESQKALGSAIKLYQSRMEAFLDSNGGIAEEDVLLQVHENATTAAWELYRTKAIGSGFFLFEEELDKSLKEIYGKMRENNIRKSIQDCEKLLRGLTKSIEDAINTGEISSIELLEEEWERKLDTYQTTARGPGKYQVQASLLEKRMLETARKVHLSVMKQHQQEWDYKFKQEDERRGKEYERLDLLYREQEENKKRNDERLVSLLNENNEWRETVKSIEDEKKELIDIALKLQERIEKSEGLALQDQNILSKRQLEKLEENDGNCLVM